MEEESSKPEQDAKVVSVRPNADANNWLKEVLQPGIVVMVCRLSDADSRRSFAQSCYYINECMREADVVHPNEAPPPLVPLLARPYRLFDANADNAWCAENRVTLAQFLLRIPVSAKEQVKFQEFVTYLVPKLNNPNAVLPLLRKIRRISQPMPSVLFITQHRAPDWQDPLRTLACTYTPSCALLLFTSPVLSLSIPDIVQLTAFAPNLTRFHIDTVMECKTRGSNLSSLVGFKTLAQCSEISIQVTQDYLRLASPDSATLWDYFKVFRVLNEAQLTFVREHGLKLLVGFDLIKMKTDALTWCLEASSLWSTFCKLSSTEEGQEKLIEITKIVHLPFWKGLVENFNKINKEGKVFKSGHRGALPIFDAFSMIPSSKAIAFAVNYMDKTDIVNWAPITYYGNYRDEYRQQLLCFLASVEGMRDEDVAFFEASCHNLFHDGRVLNTRRLRDKLLECSSSPEGQDKLREIESTTQLPFWSELSQGEPLPDRRDVVEARQKILTALLGFDLKLIQLMNANPTLFYSGKLPKLKWGGLKMTEYTEYMDYVNQLQQLSSVNFERLNGLITTVGFFKGVTYAPQHCLELMAALTAYDDSHFAIVVNPQLKFASLIHRGKSLVDQHSMIQQLGDLKVVHLETICQDPDTHFPGVGANHQVELFSFYEQRIGIIRKLEREEWQKRELKASHGIISTPAASLPVAVETAVQQLKAPAAVTKRTTRNTAVAPQAPTEIDKTIESHRAILFAHAGNEHLQKIIQGECRKLTPERIAAVVIKLKEQEEEIQNVERPFLKVLEILRSRP